MIRFFFILLGLLGLYFYQCYKHVSTNYFKYLRKTFLYYGIAAFFLPIIMDALLSAKPDAVGMFIFSVFSTMFLFGLNTVAYFVFKEIRKDDLKREAEAKESAVRSEKERQDAIKMENDDMRSMKQLMGEITQRVNALNVFNKDINAKISELELLANKTIAEAYGDIAVGVPKEKYYALYDKIHERFSPSADTIVSMQCDRIVKKISNAIDDRKRIVESNNQDISKFHSLQESLQKQYDKEYKIQRMKSFDAKVNEMTDATSDIAVALSSGSLLESTREEFDRLNIEIETRRELEVKYSTIDI